jgi:hypothetical protein
MGIPKKADHGGWRVAGDRTGAAGASRTPIAGGRTIRQIPAVPLATAPATA